MRHVVLAGMNFATRGSPGGDSLRLRPSPVASANRLEEGELQRRRKGDVRNARVAGRLRAETTRFGRGSQTSESRSWARSIRTRSQVLFHYLPVRPSLTLLRASQFAAILQVFQRLAQLAQHRLGLSDLTVEVGLRTAPAYGFCGCLAPRTNPRSEQL